MSEHTAMSGGHGGAGAIDPESEARLRAAIAELLSEMREIRALRDENAVLYERHRVIKRDIELAEDALREFEGGRPVPLWLAVVRGLLRPDRQSTRWNWHDFLIGYTKFACGLTTLYLLIASR